MAMNAGDESNSGNDGIIPKYMSKRVERAEKTRKKAQENRENLLRKSEKPEKKTYRIKLEGDSSGKQITSFVIDLTEEEAKLMNVVSVLSFAAANPSTPVLYFKEEKKNEGGGSRL